MGNPRIVRGRRGTEIAVAVRGHVLGATFVIGVERGAVPPERRMELEDRLLEEARSLIRNAEQSGDFEWSNHHFEHSEDSGVWEKTLSEREVQQLLRE